MATWRDLFLQALSDDGVVFNPDKPFSPISVIRGERELGEHTSVPVDISVRCRDITYRAYVNPETKLADVISFNVLSAPRTSGVYERMSPVHLRCIGFSGIGEPADLAGLIIEESSREARDRVSDDHRRTVEFIASVEYRATPYVPS